jgi:large subunit ribosomal protein L31e
MNEAEEVKETEATEEEHDEEPLEEESEPTEEPKEIEETAEELEAVEEPEEVEEIGEEGEITEEIEEEAEEEAEEIKPEIVDERIYTIPLSRAWITPRRKRAPRAVRLVRGFIERHMKISGGTEGEGEAARLVIANEVNEKIWSRGIEKPPRRIKVRAARDVEGTVTVYLAEGD